MRRLFVQQLPDSLPDLIKHCHGQASGLGILAAGMVGTDQPEVRMMSEECRCTEMIDRSMRKDDGGFILKLETG